MRSIWFSAMAFATAVAVIGGTNVALASNEEPNTPGTDSLLNAPKLQIKPAESTAGVDPDAFECRKGSKIDFESFNDRDDLTLARFPGLSFTTTDGFTWKVGDFNTGNYNGKYPNGSYTSQGTKWAWLGEDQGRGRIDLTLGTASYFSLLVSAKTGVFLEAYSASGTLLETVGPSEENIDTGQMSLLEISRPTKDVSYVEIHDSGNYFLIDMICSDSSGTALEDNDEDGLPDEWERNGADTDFDGSIDLDLKSMGADPLRKDLFAEVDWLTGEHGWFSASNFDARPSLQAIKTAQIAYIGFPVKPKVPGGKVGINLHIDAGPDSVMDVITGKKWGSLSRANSIVNGPRFPTWNGSWTPLDALRANNVDKARRSIFHYIVYLDEISSDKSGTVYGRSRGIPGHDLVIAKGDHGLHGDTLEANTIAHELGHNLGLGHGGRPNQDEPNTQHANKKANYLSIMNYQYTFAGLTDSRGKPGLIEFSNQELGSLNMRSTPEATGLEPDPVPPMRITYRCPSGKMMSDVATSGSIDWNCDGNTRDGSENLNLQEPIAGYPLKDPDHVQGSYDYGYLQFWGVGEAWDAANLAMKDIDIPGTGEPTEEEAQKDGVLWAPHAIETLTNPRVRIWTGTGSIALPIKVVNRGTATLTLESDIVTPARGYSLDGDALNLQPAAAAPIMLTAATNSFTVGQNERLTIRHSEPGYGQLGTTVIDVEVRDGENPAPGECSEVIAALNGGEIEEIQRPAAEAFVAECSAVTRWSGKDRYEASAKISAQSFKSGVETAFVASGLVFTDALSGSPVAGDTPGPVLLVKTDEIPPAIAAELDRLNPKRIVVLGGPATVSERVVASLTAYTP